MRIPRVLLVAEIVVLGMFAPISIDLYLPALGEMVEFFGTTESVLNILCYIYITVSHCDSTQILLADTLTA